MNPNYFYDLGYVSPIGAQMYEYTKLDSENKVDMACFYHDDMWTKGLLTDDSRTLLDQYNQIPRNNERTIMGLEFDCGSVKPALFTRFHYNDAQLNEQIYQSVTAIIGMSGTAQPTLANGVTADDLGIYPERGTTKVRYLVRGNVPDLRSFAASCGSTDADLIPNDLYGATIWNTGVSFDWDGTVISNVYFHSEALMVNDPWVQESRQHCLDHIAPLFEVGTYNLSQFVKIGLSDGFPDGYLKAYFTVRVKQGV